MSERILIIEDEPDLVSMLEYNLERAGYEVLSALTGSAGLALARSTPVPDLVLLDEPYTGLDHHAATVLRTVLETLRDGCRTVVLVTHNLTQGLELADRVAIQVRGRFAWEGGSTDVVARDFEVLYQETVDRVEGCR